MKLRGDKTSLPGRIALMLPGLYEGGAERVMLNLAEGLTGRGHEVDLVLVRAEGPYMSFVPRSVRVVELHHRRPEVLRTFRSLPALVRYLRRERPGALMSALNANFVAVEARSLARVATRVVVTQHNTLSRQYQELPGFYLGMMTRLIRRSYPRADAIVAVSDGVARDLSIVTGIPRAGIEVIYNPVITAELQSRAKEDLAHPWFAPGQPPVVLAVGRLVAQKDFPTLIKAFSRVRQARPARLLILGEGEERQALQELIRQLQLGPDVLLAGFVANPYPYMRSSSLLALSSRWEGLPTVLIEALYCGTPVVATDCPSGPREILEGGVHGRLVPVGDVDRLADALDEALSQPKSTPQSGSWTPYCLDRVVARYLKVLGGGTFPIAGEQQPAGNSPAA